MTLRERAIEAVAEARQGSLAGRAVDLSPAEVVDIVLALLEDEPATVKPRFCNQAGPMGGGCKDSWHVGGNYGSHVCRNPDHHDEPAEAEEDSNDLE